MTKLRFTLSVLATLTLTLIYASNAQAQSRVFVTANGGVDTNPCTRTSPCRQITRALQVVANKGEVVVLDSGDYESFIVSKAVTVEAAPGVVAIITPLSNFGIFVNAPERDVIVIRGLTLHGGSNRVDPDILDSVGIGFGGAGPLHVENCVISQFNGHGISFHFAGHLFVKDTLVRDNRGSGIAISPGSQIATASIDHCRLEGNSTGLSAMENSRVTIRDSVVAGNSTGFQSSVSRPAEGTAELNIENCVVTDSFGTGIQANATGDSNSAIVSVSNSTVTNNGFGILALSGGIIHVSNTTITRNGNGVGTRGQQATLNSFGDNKLFQNRITDGAFTSTVTKQ